VVHGDALTVLKTIPSESIDCFVTSPPYWTLKEYKQSEGQLGHVQDYAEFLAGLDL